MVLGIFLIYVLDFGLKLVLLICICKLFFVGDIE